MLTNAQNSEDLRLLRALSDITAGHYVDVGAADPDANSVTLIFYDAGWSGINIEPGPKFDRLASERPRDINLKVAVTDTGSSDGILYVTHPYSDLSSLSPLDHDGLDELVHRVEETSVPLRPLRAILKEHTLDPIHFLKIDVEGAERAVLLSNDWQRYRPWIVIVEAIDSGSHRQNFDEWESILIESEYFFAHFDGINRFYVESEHQHRIASLCDPIWPTSALEGFESRTQLAALADALRLSGVERERLINLCQVVQRELHDTNATADQAYNEAARWFAAAKHFETAFLSSDAQVAALAGQVAMLDEALAEAYQSRSFRLGNAMVRTAIAGTTIARKARTSIRRIVPILSSSTTSAQRLVDDATAPGRGWNVPVESPEWRTLKELGLDPTSLRSPTQTEATRLLDAIRLLGRHSEDAATRAGYFPERRALSDLELVLTALSGQRVAATRSRDGRRSGIVIDVRCLQDTNYSERGVGHHAAVVLDTLSSRWPEAELVGLVSADRPIPDTLLGSRLRLVHAAAQVTDVRAAWVISLSPMTASVGPLLPFLTEPGVRAVAVVYDFIPAEVPAAYLRTDASALAYFAQLAALSLYDTYLPISRHVGDQIPFRVGGDDNAVIVSGVATVEAHRVPRDRPEHTVFLPVGGDPRKNPLVAVAAFAQVWASDRSLRLVTSGRLPASLVQEIGGLCDALGLAPGTWRHEQYLPSDALDQMMAEAACVVVPSLREGYSIPVAHAIAAGSPVVASDIPVHRELSGPGVAFAASTDVADFARALKMALAGPRPTHRVIHSRSFVSDRVREALVERPPVPEPQRRHTTQMRPRLAVISPMPPAASGVADYSAFTLGEVARLVDLTIFSPEPASIAFPASHEPVSARAFDPAVFDATLVVVGNSHFHFSSLDYVEGLGTPVLAHDTRMFEAYLADRGSSWLHTFLSENGEPPTDIAGDAFARGSAGRAFDLLARMGSPLIVHSESLSRVVGSTTGTCPPVVPFVPYRLPSQVLDHSRIQSARRVLGLDDATFNIGLFGIVSGPTKREELTIQAAGWLRQWGVPTVVHIVGSSSPQERHALTETARTAGCEIRFHGRVANVVLEEFLIGIDAGVQLRSDARLSLSGAVADLLTFGIPTIATGSLLVDHGQPAYARPVRVDVTGILLAEELAMLHTEWDRRIRSADLALASREYLDARSVEGYARELLSVLGISP